MKLLYLDFDEDLDEKRFAVHVKMIASMCSITLETKAIHKTERGIHVILTAEWSDKQPITPTEIVCLQILLGSDFKREAFNLLRAHNLGDAPAFWQDRWNVLYTEKVKE